MANKLPFTIGDVETLEVIGTDILKKLSDAWKDDGIFIHQLVGKMKHFLDNNPD